MSDREDKKRERKVCRNFGFFVRRNILPPTKQFLEKVAHDITRFPAPDFPMAGFQGALVGFLLQYTSKHFFSFMKGSGFPILSEFPDTIDFGGKSVTAHNLFLGSSIIFFVGAWAILRQPLPRPIEYPFSGEVLNQVPEEVNFPKNLIEEGWPPEDPVSKESLKVTDIIVLIRVDAEKLIYTPCTQAAFITTWAYQENALSGNFRDFNNQPKTEADVIRVTGLALQQKLEASLPPQPNNNAL